MKKIIAIFAAFCALAACSKTEMEGVVDSISIAPEKNVFSGNGGTAEVVVKSSGDWTLEGESEWVSPSALKGKDGDKVLFKAEANDSEEQKTAEFVFRTGKATAKLELTLKGFSAEPDYVTLSMKSTSLDANGGNIEVEVKSSVDWELSGDCDWAEPSVRKGSDGDRVSFSVDPNETGAERTADFTFAAGDCSVPFEIVQTTDGAASIEIVSDRNITKSYSAHTFEVNVISDINYRDIRVVIPEEASGWLKHEVTIEGEGENAATVCFVMSPNTVEGDRSAEVQVMAGSASDRFTVFQARKSMLETETQSIEMECTGGLAEIPVTANIEYEISISQDASSWLSYVRKDGDKEIFSAGEADAKRTGRITFSEKAAPEGEEPVSFVVEVVQKGPALVTMSGDFSSSRAYAPSWNNAEVLTGMEAFTVEGLICLDSTPAEGSYYSVFGINGTFEIRVNPDNEIEIKYIENVYDWWEDVETATLSTLNGSSLEITPGQWCHFAVAYDPEDMIYCYVHSGKELAEYDYDYNNIETLPAVTLAVPYTETETEENRNFWIGYSVDNGHCFDGKLAEVRIWNKVFDEYDIEDGNHMYTVDPSSDGLVAYWKFNDGNGNVVKDHTSNGNDLQGQTLNGGTWQSGFLWQGVSLP